MPPCIDAGGILAHERAVLPPYNPACLANHGAPFARTLRSNRAIALLCADPQ